MDGDAWGIYKRYEGGRERREMAERVIGVVVTGFLAILIMSFCFSLLLLMLKA